MAASSSLAAPAPIRERARPRVGLGRHLVAMLAVFLIALAVLGYEASTSPFEADEADYVATSRYFGYLFLQGDVSRKEWGSNHWTRTQPPMTRYIVGGWLTAWGYDLEKMNQPYVSTASSFEVNRQKGRVPADDVLARSRQPMVLLGAVAIALLYPLGMLLGGPVAGLGAAGLALSSPPIRYTLVHTWAEAPLACFMLLAVLLAALGTTRMLAGGRAMGWAIGLGVALALASATKLTGLVGVCAVVATGGMLAGWIWWRQRNGRDAGRLIAWTVVAAGVALGLFVAVNPYLWRGPLNGLAGMLEERRDEMAFQQDQWPEYAVTGWTERPWLTLSGSLQIGPLAETPNALLVGLPLLLIGILMFVGRARLGRLAVSDVVMVTWTILYLAAILLGLGLKYPRYFMPTTLLFLPIVGLGLATVCEYAWRSVLRPHMPGPRPDSRIDIPPGP
jgi:4-amino-4-deoxy-L-arabinose transferase-like glycosyltransferase